MIEIVAVILKTIGEVVTQWMGASEQERIDLERRAMDSLQVLRGEKALAHSEIEGNLAETRAEIEKAKAAEEEKKVVEP